MSLPAREKRAIERLGAHRVLFGSDGPGCNPGLELRKIERLNLSQNDLRLVLHDNISSLLERVKHEAPRGPR